MTSKLKCPFCQKELKHEKTTGIYCCPTIFIDCPLGLGTGAFGTKELWQALIQAKQDLKQSERCCSAWETQALDYKAETIALSGKLEIATKVFEDIDMLLYSRKFDITELGRLNIIQHLVSRALKATEHKE